MNGVEKGSQFPAKELLGYAWNMADEMIAEVSSVSHRL